jgi:hypothetical protein
MNSTICTQDIPQEHHNLSHSVCPKGCACIICISDKEKFFHVIKNLYLGALKMLHSFVKGYSKWTFAPEKKKKKTLSFWMHSHWDSPTS